MNTSFFGEMLQTIAERGRALDRPHARSARSRRAALGQPGRAVRGAAVRPRRGLGRRARARDPRPLRRADDRSAHRLLRGAGEPVRPRPRAARRRGRRPGASAPSDAAAAELHRASEPRRQELFRRLNLAPGGTAALVRMREQLIDAHGSSRRSRRRRRRLSSTCSRPGSTAASWCCGRIDWSTPANLLEKIIRYEAVHAIRDWDDLRRRIDPPDRRCYAFFHPALIDEPLIFVEVALTRGIPAAIAPILSAKRERDRRRAGDDGGVLFDLQLPARACRRLVRQFPDQAGGRGDRARDSAAVDLRHAVAGAELRRMAQARARNGGVDACSARRTAPRSPTLDRAGLVADEAARGAGARAAAARGGLVLSARAHARAARRSIRSRASISATARGSNGSTALADTSERALRAVARPDGELPLRSRATSRRTTRPTPSSTPSLPPAR